MKKIIFSLFVLLAVCTKTAAQIISVEDVEMRTGNTTVTIALNVHGAEDMTSMHLEISDPSELFAIQSASATSAWAALFSTGSAGMSAISTSVNAFTGDGIVASIELSVPEDIAIGTYPISITNVRINGADIDGTTFNVTVTDCITLDENSVVAPEAAEAVKVRVLRTINANSWSTICLPFAMTEAQVKTAFGDDVQLGDFTGYDITEDGDDIIGITVNFDSATEIEANHPYIIKVGTQLTEFTVDGVDISPEDAPSVSFGFTTGKGSKAVYHPIDFNGTYVADFDFYNDAQSQAIFLSGNKFYYATEATMLMKAFRGYFDFDDVLSNLESSSARIAMRFDKSITDIDKVSVRKPDLSGAIFDLQGRRVNNPVQGIYIKEGKKIAIEY